MISSTDTRRTRYSPIKRRVIARDSTLSERAAAAAVWAVMKAKTKIGMGVKAKKKSIKKKKRILPTAKRGGYRFCQLFGALWSLIRKTASVAKAVNDRKTARWKRADQDCISLHTNADENYISLRTDEV
ncbi:hypothetical protein P5V15_001405 [Pogonomyrmex californicus]